MLKNSKLQNLFCLSHKVTVYVPATMGVDTPIDNTAQVQATAALLSELFGGATSSKAIGYWLSPAAGLVAEGTTVVFAFAAEDALAAGIDKVVDHCNALKAEMHQEAVALEVDGTMYFV